MEAMAKHSVQSDSTVLLMTKKAVRNKRNFEGFFIFDFHLKVGPLYMASKIY